MNELVLILRQPAQIGDRARDDNVLGTLDYLPGAVVRGAFAAAWLARNGVSVPGSSRRAEFLRLFEGDVRFGPLLPPGTEFTALSVLTHKYAAAESCVDVEYDRAVTGAVPGHCPDCGSPLEQKKALRGERPAPHRRTSVSIKSSGVAQRGVLFTRETLAAGQEFYGPLIARDPALLAILAGLGPVRIGGRRTTHGLAELGIRETAAPPAVLRRDDGMLVIRMGSPGIFTDPEGRPSRDPDPSELTEILGTAAHVVQRWSRWQQVGGWHVASGLPKPSELAVAAGSTYVISPEGPVDDSALAELGSRGLGLRRHEGFGDLAPPQRLIPGRRARDEQARRRTGKLNEIAALRGMPVTRQGEWPHLLADLTAHAVGDPAAAGRLLAWIRDYDDARIGSAVRAFLAFTPEDAAYAVGELSR